MRRDGGLEGGISGGGIREERLYGRIEGILELYQTFADFFQTNWDISSERKLEEPGSNPIWVLQLRISKTPKPVD
jgi:hypothetical protein